MLIINKPDEFQDVQCYRCNTIMKAHPMTNMNSDYFTNCDLHKCNHIFIHITDIPKCIRCNEIPNEFKKCLHEDDGNHYLTQPVKTKCKKCGDFY